jgi:hypothetical protein
MKWLISKELIGFGYLFGAFLLQTISKILDSLWMRDQVNRAWALFQRLSRILDIVWSGNAPNPNPININHFTLCEATKGFGLWSSCAFVSFAAF